MFYLGRLLPWNRPNLKPFLCWNVQGTRLSRTSGARNMGGAYWLLKTEPDCWSWDQQSANSGLSVWDGVRNPQAQKLMKSMSEGDLCFFYHTGKLKEVAGICRVVKEFYPDPTDDSGKWGAVDVKEIVPLQKPVTLTQMKEDELIQGFQMLRQPRLSVVPVGEKIWERVCELGEVVPAPLLPSHGTSGEKAQTARSDNAKQQQKKSTKVARPPSSRRGATEDEDQKEEEDRKKSKKVEKKTSPKSGVSEKENQKRKPSSRAVIVPDDDESLKYNPSPKTGRVELLNGAENSKQRVQLTKSVLETPTSTSKQRKRKKSAS